MVIHLTSVKCWRKMDLFFLQLPPTHSAPCKTLVHISVPGRHVPGCVPLFSVWVHRASCPQEPCCITELLEPSLITDINQQADCARSKGMQSWCGHMDPIYSTHDCLCVPPGWGGVLERPVVLKVHRVLGPRQSCLWGPSLLGLTARMALDFWVCGCP